MLPGCSRSVGENRCGNGVVDEGEECDLGAANSDEQPDACRTDCRRAHCGDGVIDSEETCDDANSIELDGCTACESSEFRVSSASSGVVLDLAVAMNADGNWAVAWAELTEQAAAIFVRMYSRDGQPESDPIRVNPQPEPVTPTPDTPGVATVSVAVGPLGETAVLWRRSYAPPIIGFDDPRMYIRTYGVSTAPSSDSSRIDDPSAPPSGRPRIGATSDGRYVVAWHTPEPDQGRIVSQFFGWDLVPELEGGIEVGVGATPPALTVSPTDDLALIWARSEAGTTAVLASQYNHDSGQFRAPVTLASLSETPPLMVAPSASSTLDGSVAACWYQVDSSRSEVACRRISTTGELGAPFLSDATPDPVVGARPAVVSLENDRLGVIWDAHSEARDPADILWQPIDGLDPSAGAPTSLNSLTRGSTTGPVAASDLTDCFVVLWSSSRYDSPEGLFGQRYTRSGTPLGLTPSSLTGP